MRIVVLCEGKTEEALRNGLRELVQKRSIGNRVGISTRGLDGPVLRKKLRALVDLHGANKDVVGVIALTDLYPSYTSVEDAKAKLKKIVSGTVHLDKFRVHVAKYEIEAWLMPFWTEIAGQLRVNAQPPGANPEEINDQKPPSFHLKELYRRARDQYDKVIDGKKWLTADRLETASQSCPELKSFLNSLLDLAGANE